MEILVGKGLLRHLIIYPPIIFMSVNTFMRKNVIIIETEFRVHNIVHEASKGCPLFNGASRPILTVETGLNIGEPRSLSAMISSTAALIRHDLLYCCPYMP